MMWSVLAGCCWFCSPLHSVSLSDALHGALNAWDSPEDLIPSVTDRQHILLLLSATRGIKKGFAALISLCFFFGTFSIGLEGGIVNALHKAHNNKETQLGRRENGMGGGGGWKDNPESCAYYLWNLTAITESILCKCARLSVSRTIDAAPNDVQSWQKRK